MTRSLGPHVLLRDSSIPWLDKIPAHWAVTRLKFVAEVQGGLTLGKNYGAAILMEYPYLRVANVQDGYLDLSDVATILVSETEAESCLLKAGDVLMNEGGTQTSWGADASGQERLPLVFIKTMYSQYDHGSSVPSGSMHGRRPRLRRRSLRAAQSSQRTWLRFR